MTLCNFENCRNRGDYGIKTQQPTRCKTHKELDMVTRPKSYCEHNIRKDRCKECGGVGICEHNRERCRCKECGGSQICEHNRVRSRCKECEGGSICEHKKRKDKCNKCSPNSPYFCKEEQKRSYQGIA